MVNRYNLYYNSHHHQHPTNHWDNLRRNYLANQKPKSSTFPTSVQNSELFWSSNATKFSLKNPIVFFLLLPSLHHAFSLSRIQHLTNHPVLSSFRHLKPSYIKNLVQNSAPDSCPIFSTCTCPFFGTCHHLMYNISCPKLVSSHPT